MNLLALRFSCLSSCSYIKPQLENSVAAMAMGCLSSCSYIKPQLFFILFFVLIVVYHLVPTSNHNYSFYVYVIYFVVYHLVPTSNHNYEMLMLLYYLLFIILFLHQTTTHYSCFLISFGCLSSCSYIKPQLFDVDLLFLIVVYHLVPTSNHNL